MPDLPTDIFFIVVGFACLVLSAVLLRRDARQISSGVLLVVSFYLLTKHILSIVAPNYITDKGELAIGKGDETMMLIMMILMVIAFFGGIWLLVNSIRLCRREGVSLANLLPAGFGVLGIIWPLSYAISIILFAFSDPSLATIVIVAIAIIQNILAFVPIMLTATFISGLLYKFVRHPKANDYIIVLGCGLRSDGRTPSPLLASRLDVAIREYFLEHQHPNIIVSGGKGSDEKLSEAAAMRNYLLARDIPASKILLENQSVNTDENIKFSKRLCDKTPNYTALIATSEYHVLRGVILARRHQLNAQGIGARTVWYYRPAAWLREYMAFIFDYHILILIYVLGVVALSLTNFIR
jgi:uncharacterized SAM-binding protein YcdF (DUF218 family)